MPMIGFADFVGDDGGGEMRGGECLSFNLEDKGKLMEIPFTWFTEKKLT